ncbi:MAG: hypothetical protein LUG93_01850 [Lachnospiraceae bacterium]|nr:hypothetical protein [Lachnospiraceae bacterium]
MRRKVKTLKNRIRKSLSVLLAVCLIAGMIPDAVFAQEDAGTVAAVATTEAASEAVAASEETGAAETADTGETQAEATKTETEASTEATQLEAETSETETAAETDHSETEAAAETTNTEAEAETDATTAETETETMAAAEIETEAAQAEESETAAESGTEAETEEVSAETDGISSETESETHQETGTEAETETETETAALLLGSTAATLCDHGNDADTCAICEVEALIDELPGVDEIAQMDVEEQNDVYTQASDICDIYYDELTEDEQEQVSNIGELWEILDYFSGLVSLTAGKGRSAATSTSPAVSWGRTSPMQRMC